MEVSSDQMTRAMLVNYADFKKNAAEGRGKALVSPHRPTLYFSSVEEAVAAGVDGDLVISWPFTVEVSLKPGD